MLLGIAVVIPAVIATAWAISLRPAQPIPARGSFHDLTYTVGTDKIEYAPGETVQVVGNVTNIGVATVTIFRQGGSCGSAMLFRDADGRLWYFSGYGQLCPLIVVPFPLAPGKSIVSIFDWGQRDFNGSLVPSGRAYRVEAHDGWVSDSEGKTEGVIQGETWFFIRSAG